MAVHTAVAVWPPPPGGPKRKNPFLTALYKESAIFLDGNVKKSWRFAQKTHFIDLSSHFRGPKTRKKVKNLPLLDPANDRLASPGGPSGHRVLSIGACAYWGRYFEPLRICFKCHTLKMVL